MVSSEDRVKVDGLASQESKPLLLGEFRTLGGVGKTLPGCLEIKGVVFDELQGELQFRMEEGTANLSNRLPWELGFIDPWLFHRP